MNVTSTVGGYLMIEHFDSGFIVAIKGSWLRLGKTKFKKNGTEVFGMFSSTDCSIEFSFGRTCGSQRLGFAFVGNSATGEQEGKTRGRTATGKVISMSGIEEASDVGASSKGRKGRQSRVHGKNFKRARR